MKYYKHYIVDNHKIKKAALLRQPLFLWIWSSEKLRFLHFKFQGAVAVVQKLCTSEQLFRYTM